MTMKQEHINPFIAAAKNVIKISCNDEIELGKLSLKKLPLQTSDVVIVLGIVGNVKGQVIFSIDEDVTMAIASKMMMGMPVTKLDEMAKSAICELANMILGNAATIFSNNKIVIDITPPSILIGKDMTVSTVKGDFISIPLNLKESGIGFEVNVCLVEG